MLRTGIPVSVLGEEEDAVIMTAVELLNDADRDPSFIDPEDLSTIPEEWR
jgi:hypothetical protein